MSDSAIDPFAVSATGHAPGRFAPGHLGELTAQIPFEMVDEVLAATRREQRRTRLLPARVVVYLLLAGALFTDQGWSGVWARLSAGLPGAGRSRRPMPARSWLWAAMRRLGPAPLKALFDLLKGPAATRADRHVRFAGRLVVAIDGTTVSVPDEEANRRVYRKQKGNGNGDAGHPAMRMLTLIACGTRSLLEAAFGPTGTGETAYAARLLDALRPGMLLLGDRNLPSKDLVAKVAATGADFLMRVRTAGGPTLAPIEIRADGTRIAMLGSTRVRVIDATVTLTTGPGTADAQSQTSSYRLITSLDAPEAFSAEALTRLYHERWEIETSYCELKSTMLHGRVLRGRAPEAIAQETWALLCTYQALRTAMSEAALTAPAVDPDRASFTIALNTARDRVVHPDGLATDPHDLIGAIGAIGAAVLASLLPARRPRTHPRAIKRAISKYQARARNIDRTCRPAAITHQINTLTTEPEP